MSQRCWQRGSAPFWTCGSRTVSSVAGSTKGCGRASWRRASGTPRKRARRKAACGRRCSPTGSCTPCWIGGSSRWSSPASGAGAHGCGRRRTSCGSSSISGTASGCGPSSASARKTWQESGNLCPFSGHSKHQPQRGESPVRPLIAPQIPVHPPRAKLVPGWIRATGMLRRTGQPKRWFPDRPMAAHSVGGDLLREGTFYTTRVSPKEPGLAGFDPQRRGCRDFARRSVPSAETVAEWILGRLRRNGGNGEDRCLKGCGNASSRRPRDRQRSPVHTQFGARGYRFVLAATFLLTPAFLCRTVSKVVGSGSDTI